MRVIAPHALPVTAPTDAKPITILRPEFTSRDNPRYQTPAAISPLPADFIPPLPDTEKQRIDERFLSYSSTTPTINNPHCFIAGHSVTRIMRRYVVYLITFILIFLFLSLDERDLFFTITSRVREKRVREKRDERRTREKRGGHGRREEDKREDGKSERRREESA